MTPGFQMAVGPVPQSCLYCVHRRRHWASVLAGLLRVHPASISYAQQGASRSRAFSPGLLWQCEPDFSDFLYPVSLRLHGMRCLPFNGDGHGS